MPKQKKEEGSDLAASNEAKKVSSESGLDDVFDALEAKNPELAELSKGTDEEEEKPAKKSDVAEESGEEESSEKVKKPKKVQEELKEEKKQVKEEKKSKGKVKKASARSKKYQEIVALVEKEKLYPVDEAIDLVKKVSYSKFVGSLEIHIRISQNKSKKKGPTESTRFMVDLPNGTGKTKTVVVLNDDLIEEISKTKTVPADIYLATPDMMPKVGKIARILGTQGKMPNPKSGTVTNDIEKTKEALVSGRVELRADGGNIIHQAIGRLDWDNDKLKQNYQAVVAVLPKAKIMSLTLAPSMGPGVKVKIK